jgi:hypothetical protein
MRAHIPSRPKKRESCSTDRRAGLLELSEYGTYDPPMAKQGVLRPLREWTEDCRVRQHRQCDHIGSTGTVGLLGARAFVTICSCPCHWGCPAETIELSEMKSVCTCLGNGEERQRNFEAVAK